MRDPCGKGCMLQGGAWMLTCGPSMSREWGGVVGTGAMERREDTALHFHSSCTLLPRYGATLPPRDLPK